MKLSIIPTIVKTTAEISSSSPSCRDNKKNGNMNHELGPNDIIIGRGRKFENNSGNKRFRELVRQNLNQYIDAPARQDKSILILSLFHVLRDDIGARFVKPVGNNEGQYEDCDPQEARDKVAHALRDLAAKHSRQLKHLKLQHERTVQQRGQGGGGRSSAAEEVVVPSSCLSSSDTTAASSMRFMDTTTPTTSTRSPSYRQPLTDERDPLERLIDQFTHSIYDDNDVVGDQSHFDSMPLPLQHYSRYNNTTNTHGWEDSDGTQYLFPDPMTTCSSNDIPQMIHHFPTLDTTTPSGGGMAMLFSSC